MIEKIVKEYGTKTKRQRIDLNKKDGFAPGDEVIIIQKDKFNEIKQDIMDLQSEIIVKNKDIEIYKNRITILSDQEQKQELNLKEIIQDVTTPIYENHKKELDNKDLQIKQLEIQLKSLENKTKQYNLDMMGLNTIDVLFRSKHKHLIQKFNNEISLIINDPKIVDVETPGLPGSDKSQAENNKTT